MIAALIRLDLRLLLRSRAAWLLVFLLVGAAALALVSGLDWRERYVRAADGDRSAAAKSETELRDIYVGMAKGTTRPTDVDKFDGNGEYIPDPRDPYVAGYHHIRLAELPPGPLLGLATGSSELRATHHRIQSVPLYTLLRIGEPAERVNPGALAAGRFDLLAFIMYLCPLALVALLFDATAREREGGIAPLLSGLGVDRRRLLLARGMVRGGLVMAVALGASLVGLVLVGALGSAAGLWWLGGTIAYLLFWTTLLLAVAASSLSVVGTAAVSVALWVALLLLSPGLTERALRPAGLFEPRVLADADVRRILREDGGPAGIEAATKRVARDYWGIDFATAPACAYRKGVIGEYVGRRLTDESYAKSMRAGMSRELLFDQRLDRWGWLSPALAFRRSMEQVAGSDPARQRAFELGVINYHARWRDRVTAALFDCGQLDRAAFENAPRFAWVEPAGGATPVIGVGAALLLALGLGATALKRRPLSL